jgi:FemAB family
MRELRVEAQVDPRLWNASLRAGHGTIFHTADWARYVQAEEPGARPEFVTLLDCDGSNAGQALVFNSRSSRILAAPFTGRRWLHALPVVRDNSPATLSRFVELIERHARQAGDVTFQVGSFASPASQAILRPLGFSLARRLEFELDLTRDEKTLWEGMEYRRRRNIKKAMKAGVEVREVPAYEGVSHLRRLQAASFERIVRRGGPPFLPFDSSRQDPTESLSSAGLGRIVGGFVNGVCVTASFFTTFNGLAYDALLGHDPLAFETQAPSLLLWEMARRFKSEGIQRLNLGGCGIDALEESSPEHGVYVYKKTFGGAVLECGTGDKILRPAVHRAADLLRAAMR